ncbi:MAG: hypothetical protein ABIY50_05125 [Ignavibacteria bacterium]
MKKYIFISFIISSFISLPAYSQVPTYTLSAKNFSVNSFVNQVEFDIYVQHTNSPTPFEYAAGQYYFSFNSLIANGGVLNYTIVGSDLPVAMQPRNPSIGTAENPTANILKLAMNMSPGAGNGFIMTGNGSPGTKIARVRLETSAKFFDVNELFNIRWRNPPVVSFATKLFAYVNTAYTEITTSNTHSVDTLSNFVPPRIILKIAAAVQGLYNSSTNRLNRRDTIKAYLRDDTFPYAVRDSASSPIDTISFTGVFNFSYNTPSDRYYIVIRHFNSIETWSRAGGEILNKISSHLMAVPTYNFTSAVTQAFGNNLILKGSKYCIYSGDVNQDGIIDASDISFIDNDAFEFISGPYLPTDVNGDNIIDGSDLSIADNNAINFIGVARP